jgi:precorrin-3B C17-methyltransferase
MAGLVLELLAHQAITSIQVEVLPGITALNAAAALLGAPLMTDFAAISLSDYLIPLETILARLQAAIQGDFVIGLYNPLSHQRREPFERACSLLLNALEEDRPVGIVRAAFRPEQEVYSIPLKELPVQQIGMDCIVIIGNRTTCILNGKMVTPRGYSLDRPPAQGPG